ncbi:MAG: hypothetical protein AAGJ46_00620 [Planctomycetota bacterium]
MAVDPYAFCPCGSGNKLKFCCSDLAADIDKIQTMIEGDQPRAALRHVDQTLAKSPKRESLLDLKVRIELMLDDVEAAATTVAEFLEVGPENPTAHAQNAVVQAASRGGRAAVTPLQQALALVEKEMPRQVLQAIGAVAQTLLAEGNVLAAQAHLWLYQGVAGPESGALELLYRLNRMDDMPLPFREQWYMRPAAEGHPGETDHHRAQWYASSGRWLPAAQALDSLCSLYPDEPSFAYNRGLVYGWLGDLPRLVAGMHQFAASPGVPREEAVEAEAMALLIDPTLQDPPIDVVRVDYPIADEGAMLAALGADDRVFEVPVDPEQAAAEDGPPPRKMFALLDKPLPETGADITRDRVPNVLGMLTYYGRQTDRHERLSFTLDKGDGYESALALLGEVTGGSLQDTDGEERLGASNVAEQVLSWRWHFPPDTPPALRRELLSEQRREAILTKWPETPRHALGDKSPREAAKDTAGDPALKLRLEALVLLLEQGRKNHKYGETFAELRRELGLEELGPIDASTVDVLMTPLGRLTRIDLSAVSDDDLEKLYRKASLAAADAAVAHTAREALRRPSLAERIPYREAYDRLLMLEDDNHKALELVEEARQMADARGESNAAWDLMELELHVLENEPDKAHALLEHLRDEHGKEPGVAEQIYQLMYALGAFREGEELQPGAAMPGTPLPGAEPASSLTAEPEPATTSGIWTPDSETGGGGKKLWTPT